MKTKLNGFLTLFIALLVQISFAQDRVVTGVVTDNSGLPIPGVNVLVKGTKSGTQTDFDGKYSIKATTTQTLIFNFVGMKSQEIIASSSSINLKMKDDAVELEGVVVTALGIKREKKSLGYSSQKVDGSAVNTTPTNNFLNNLSGKVAGVEIRNNGNFGGSTNIVMRGTKSIGRSNQVLMVIDGVAISNTNLNTADAANARDGYDFGNSTSDIDPNNIESINVLKGAAATALYGSEASNGALIITTKKGKNNNALGVSYSSTVSTGVIDKSTFVHYQKKYGGGGYDGHDNLIVTDVNGDGIDDLLDPTGYDISYGNAFDPNLMVYQWNAFVQGNAHFGQPTPWVAAKNDPSKFFDRSTGFTNSVNINGGDDKTTYNLTLTNNKDTGVMPNSNLLKNIISGSFSRDLSDKLKFGVNFSYSDQSTTGRNNVGYGNNFLGSFRQWWQVNNDIKELQQAYFQDRNNVTWNMNDPTGGNFNPATFTGGDLSPAYWDNPYWDRYENYENDSHNRLLLGANLSYDITKNFNVLGRFTAERTNDRQEQRLAIGSVPAEWGLFTNQSDQSSGYELYTRAFAQENYDFIATYDLKLSDKLGLKLLGGGTLKHYTINAFDGTTTGGLITPRFYNLTNSAVYTAPNEDFVTYKKSGIYAQTSFDFDKFLYLEGTWRRDASTALPHRNGVYDYMSLGTSFVFNQFIKKDWLDLAKIRASYAEVGNDPAAPLVGNKRFIGTIDGNPMYSNSSTYVDFGNLKPELTRTWEAGIESAMFKNRLTFELSWYKSNTKDQLLTVPQSTATGFTYSFINAGEVQNTGVELLLSGTPIKTPNFQWQVTVNWSKNKNKVLSLNGGRSNYQLASFQSGITLNATVGEAYGTIKGTDYVYDDHGNRIVGDDGNYLQSDTNDKTIGNIQPDWIGGISNKFTYKNLSLGFLIDVKKGGSVFSLDQGYGQDTGLYTSTAGINDLGNPVRNSLANGGGYINSGVMANPAYVPGNGQPQYIPNTTRVNAEDSSEASGSGYGISANPDRAFVYDASYVKLREMSLSYSMPSKFLAKTFIKGATFSLLGNNLWIIHKNLPDADPEAGTSSGNVQGYQSGVMPTVKVYSFNVKVNF